MQPGATKIRKATLDVTVLWLGSVLGAGLAFATLGIAARELGSQQFGLFSSVLAMAGLVIPVAGFGVSQFWLHLFGQDSRGAYAWIKPSVQFMVGPLAIAFGIAMVWAVVGPHAHEASRLLLLSCLYVLGQLAVELVSSKLQIERRYVDLAWWQLAPQLVRFLAVACAAVASATVLTSFSVMLVFAVVGGVAFGVGVLQLRTFCRDDFGTTVGREPSPNSWAVLCGSWPFATAALLNIIYYQSNVVIVKYLAGDVAAGEFSLAASVMAGVYLLPTAIYQKYLLPKLYSWLSVDSHKLLPVFRWGNSAMVLLGLGAAIVVFLMAPMAVMLFGQEYAGTVKVLRVLAFSAPFMFLAIGAGSLLATSRMMKRKVSIMAIVAVANVCMNIVLVRKGGAVGAAQATVVTYGILATLYYLGSRTWIVGRVRAPV